MNGPDQRGRSDTGAGMAGKRPLLLVCSPA